MRKLIILITLCFCTLVQGQTKDLNDKERNRSFGFSLVQDVKLAIMQDDAGNKPFTTDITFRWEWRAFSSRTGYFSLVPNVEYAELTGGKYFSYGVFGAYTFDEFLYVPTFGLLNRDCDLDITPYAGLSVIQRKWADMEQFNYGYQPFGPAITFGLDLTIKVSDRTGIMFDFKLVDRRDLAARYGTTGLTKNFAVG